MVPQVGDARRLDDQPALPAAVELRGVTKSYSQGDERTPVLHGVDLRLETGEFVSLVGPSGSGKSTVLHLAGGLDVPDAGTVEVAGQDIAALSAEGRARLRRREIGFIFQFFHLLPGLTVAENVAVPHLADRASDSAARTAEALERVSLAHRAKHLAHQLSGGEMQRVAIARALVVRPKVILADEPTGNLDSKAGAAVIDLLHEAVADGTALLLVTHDPNLAALASRTVAMRDGRIT